MLKINLPKDRNALKKLTVLLLRYVDPETYQLFQETDYGTSSHVFLVIGPETNSVEYNGLVLKLRQRNYQVCEYNW